VKPSGLPDVGVPDPERKTSPIVDETYEDDESVEDEEEPIDPGIEGEGVCYFNDVAYRAGEYVWAGNEVLRCDRGGVWVRIESEPE